MKIRLKNSGVFLFLAGVLFLAGCGERFATGPNETIETPHAAVEAAAPSTRNDTVIIKQMKFNPETIHVKKGHTVVWINEGVVPHNVMHQPDTLFVSDTLAVGDVWEMAITEGFHYMCSIHPTMSGEVIVDP